MSYVLSRTSSTRAPLKIAVSGVQAGLVSRLSQGTTLEAGSLILTGTPAALNRSGDNIDPWLKHGDDVHCWVEGCGTLINPVIEEERVGRAKL